MIYKLDMELKLVSGTAYRKPKNLAQWYYITMQVKQKNDWKIHWLIGGCSLIIPPMISRFRENLSARNFHVIHRGPGTETEKALFPFIFLRKDTSIYTSRKKELTGALGVFWKRCCCICVCCFTLICSFYSSTSRTPSVRADSSSYRYKLCRHKTTTQAATG